MQIQEIVKRLELKSGRRCYKSGKGFQACCPAHEDSNPSLSIEEDPSGKILIHCFAGCNKEAICRALDIKLSDLFNNSSSGSIQQKSKVEYLYHNVDWSVLYKKVRIEPGKNGKKKEFYFEKFSDGKWIKNMDKVERVLYRLPEIIKAKEKNEKIYLTEGEKDCDRLREESLVATTTPESAAGPWRLQYTDSLKGAHIILLYDEDIAGHGRRNAILRELYGKAASIKVVQLPGLVFTKNHGADVSDWLGMGHTIEELKKLVDETPVYNSTTEKKPTYSSQNSQLLIPGGAQSIQDAGRMAGVLLKQTGRFFTRGGALVQVSQENDGEPYLNPIKPSQLASEIELVAQVVKNGKNGVEPTVLNVSLAQLIMDSSSFRKEISDIRILSKSPVLNLGVDGELHIIIGYDEKSGVLSFATPPKKVSLETAINLVLGLFSDFKFATPSDRSRAVAALITPALVFGQIIRARAPIIVIEADESQTGKGYLVKLIAGVYNHKPRPITQRKGLGNIEESLNMRLIKGDSFISLDNIRGKIDSPALESLLTEDHYLARVPYMPPIDIDLSRVVLFLTSNQCEMTKDLANRSCSIQLRKQYSDYTFKSFSEGDLIDHVLANNSLYCGAIVTIVNEWICRGRPQTNENCHDFRKWVRSLDWIAQHIMGLSPLMSGHKEIQKRVVNKQMNWIRSISLLVIKISNQNEWLRTGDLLNLIEDSDLSIPGLYDSDNLSDSETRMKILTAMGKELGMGFKDSRKIFDGNASIDEITIDEIRIQRRLVKESRGGTSGTIEVKEYRFLQHDSFSTNTPSSAIDATDHLQCSDERSCEPVNNT